MTDKRANCEHKLYPLQHVDNKDKCDYCGTPVDIPQQAGELHYSLLKLQDANGEYVLKILTNGDGFKLDALEAFIAAASAKTYESGQRSKWTAGYTGAYEAGQRATLLDASAYEQGYTAGRIAEGKTCEAASRHDYKRRCIEELESVLKMNGSHLGDWHESIIDRITVLKLALKETNPTEVTRANTALNSPKSEGENHAKS